VIKYLEFADAFEQRFVRQARDEDRTFEETFDLGWELLSMHPKSELKKIDDKYVAQYYRG